MTRTTESVLFLFSRLRSLASSAPTDGSAQSTKPKVSVSSNQESMPVFGLKWDRNNGTLFVNRCINSTIQKKFSTALGLKSCVKGLRPNLSCRTVYCWCLVILKTKLACQWTKLE